MTDRQIRMDKKDVDKVHPEGDGFREKLSPIKMSDAPDVFAFKCDCGGIHFRHAGYLEIVVPFLRPGNDKGVSVESCQVKVCIQCRKAYLWLNEQIYDVSDSIDMEAWAEFEREAQDVTGPGGEC